MAIFRIYNFCVLKSAFLPPVCSVHFTLTSYPHSYTLNSLSLLWLAESVQWILEISPCELISADSIIMLRVWVIMSRSWVIMSGLCTLCCFLSVKKQKLNFHFSVQCTLMQWLESVFVISRIIKVSVMVISLILRLQLITPTSTLIIWISQKPHPIILFIIKYF